MMAVKIRLRRTGTNKRPHYRIVVADARFARNGRIIESLGTYDPVPQPVALKLDGDRALHWLQRGAQPTDTARHLLSAAGVMRRYAEERARARGAPAA
jgi:small subunit ribosomal protein S16